MTYPVLPSALDNLAANRIVDFDSESFLKGATPRYVGAPRTYMPFETPLPVIQAQSQPIIGAPQMQAPLTQDVYGGAVTGSTPVNGQYPQVAQETNPQNNKNNPNKIPTWKVAMATVLGAGLVAAGGYGCYKYSSTISKAIPKTWSEVGTALSGAGKKVADWAQAAVDFVKTKIHTKP